MEKINESIFPMISRGGEILTEGISMRSFFANSAPSDIPEWFEFKGESWPPQPNFDYIEESSDRDLLTHWADNFGSGIKLDDRFKPEQAAYTQRRKDWCKEINAVDKRNEKNRYFAWRTFYADQLIEQLNKPV